MLPVSILRVPSLQPHMSTTLVSHRRRLLSSRSETCAGSKQYSTDIEHWMTSSAQTAACSVEPGTSRDVGIIVCFFITFCEYFWFIEVIPLAPNPWFYAHPICGQCISFVHEGMKATCIHSSPDIYAIVQVKGAGHTSNPGFSSTKGVQIAMYRFSKVCLQLDQ
jgi:hypothetical protein